MRISQKHRDFVAEPMGEKPMGSLVGIGEVMGKKLEERGFDKACIVLGQFLVFKMKTSSGNGGRTRMVPTPSIKDCFGCLWSDAMPLPSCDAFQGFFLCHPSQTPSRAPAMNFWSLYPSEDFSLVFYKGKDCCCTCTSNVLQGLLGVLSPHRWTFFGILTLACISLFFSLPILCQQLPAFLSEFLTPSLTYTFTPDLFYAIPPSFFFFQNNHCPCKFLKTIK